MAQARDEVTLGGRYRLLARIASGGMGTVWEAEDAVLHRRVAVKVLSDALGADERFVERFRREARSAAGLTHPNVAGVFDYGEDDGVPYIVMELIPGRTLAEILADRGRLPPAEAARVGRDVALALQAAHDAGVVHRDVKPGNVMLTPRGEVKVMDFGIAATSGASLTATGAAMGTASYISPEQASGERATPASDVYSLGCVVYEMVAGRPPFEGSNPVAVATAHVRDVPRSLGLAAPEAPPTLVRAVDGALAKDPARRPPSAAAFAALLDTATGSSDAATTAVLPAANPPTRPLPRSAAAAPDAPPPRRARHRAWLLAGILAAVVALAAMVSALTGGDVAKPPGRHSGTPSPAASLTSVPNVVGLPLSDAISKLTDAGLVVGDTRATDGQVGTIIRTDPGPGGSIRAGASVTLYVGTGAGGGDHGDHQDNGKGKKKHGPGED